MCACMSAVPTVYLSGQNGVAVKLTGRIGFREGYLRFREAELEDGRIVREQNPTLEE